MKIIIAHSQTKREIKGSFELCGSWDDLHSIASQILSEIGKEEEKRITYGWLTIVADKPATLANTPPQVWDPYVDNA